MSFFSEALKPQRSIDSKAMIIAASMLVIFAPNAFNFLPFMLAGAAEALSLTDAQIENVTVAELLATAISSLIFSLALIRRVNWRYVGYASAAALIVGNIMSMNAVDYDGLSLGRIVSGAGQGIGYSLGLVGMSVTKNPGRNFGFMIAALNIWLITWFISLPMLMEMFGLDALYNFFIFASVLCLVAFWFYPNNGRLDKDARNENVAKTTTMDKKHFIIPMLWVGGAFMVYSLSLGIIYPYVEIIGASMNATTDEIGLVLAVGSILAVVGALLTSVMDQRYSHISIMVFVGIVNAAVCFAMAYTNSTVIFLFMSCIYIMAWNVAYARYYTALATTDRSGYFSSYGPEIGTVGLAAGPALAQALTMTGDFQGQVGVGAFSIVAATIMAVIGMRKATKVINELESTSSVASAAS